MFGSSIVCVNNYLFADTDAFKALEHRQGDKLAKEFIKKYKQKIGSPKN